MKIIFGALLSFCFALNNCLAQEGQPIQVSILKENKEIDNLMDMVFKDEILTGQINEHVPGDSCWMLEMFKWNDNYFSFQIVRNKKAVINFRVNKLESNKANYGFFSFKGNKIFVWSKDNFTDYFIKTGGYQTFNFIYYSNDSSVTNDELYPHTIHYKFTDGHFSTEGPPPVKSPIK